MYKSLTILEKILKNLKNGGDVMAQNREVGTVLKCEVCGNVVEVKEVGVGIIICCGQPMVEVEE